MKNPNNTVFKILNGYENIYTNMFFSLKKDCRTRRHQVKVEKDQSKLEDIVFTEDNN